MRFNIKRLGEFPLNLGDTSNASGGISLLTMQTTSVTPTTFDPVLTLSGGAPTPEWDMGDGTQLTGASISHTYASAGTKTVTLGTVSLYPFITVFDANSDDITGAIPDFSLNTSLVTLQLNSNQLTGAIPDFSANTSLVNLYLYNNQLTGAIPDFSLNTSLAGLRLYNNQLDSIVTGSFVGANALNDVRLQSNGMVQSVVDEIVEQIYSNRANYTSTTPSMNIGGTNAAPSGTYQYSAAPSTGKEKIYALVNDDDGEGFNKWAVTFTA